MPDTAIELAQTVEALIFENARLREALMPFALYAAYIAAKDCDYAECSMGLGKTIKVQAFRDARAALGGSHE